MGIIISLDELKAVAKSYGYKLIKIPERVELKPCTCGRKRLSTWYGADGNYIFCPSCGRQGPIKKTVREAKIGWNERIRC